MGKQTVSAPDNPSRNQEDSWRKIFKGLVDMVEDQQRQLESLVEDRKSLEDRIFQMGRDSKIKDIARFVDDAKAKLMISMKQKEALMNNLKFEEANDECADLKLLFKKVSQCLAKPKRVTRSNGKGGIDESALKAERDFAWNQFKKTDNKLQELVNRTRFEVKSANEKVMKLVADLDQSHALNMEKNRTISALQDEVAVLRFDSRKKSEEISRLTKELEVLRGDSYGSITPVLRRCMVKSSKASHSGDMVVVEKGVRCSKRKGSGSEPRLFTSKFKVPKLKA